MFESTGYPPLKPTAVLKWDYPGHNGVKTLVVSLFGPVTKERLAKEHAIMDHRAKQLNQAPRPERKRQFVRDDLETYLDTLD